MGKQNIGLRLNWMNSHTYRPIRHSPLVALENQVREITTTMTGRIRKRRNNSFLSLFELFITKVVSIPLLTTCQLFLFLSRLPSPILMQMQKYRARKTISFTSVSSDALWARPCSIDSLSRDTWSSICTNIFWDGPSCLMI